MDLDPASLIVGVIVSSIGFGLFLFGKKQARALQLCAGVVLMALPLVVPAALFQAAAAGAVLVGTWWLARSA
ncbi:MAG: hypothetical protein JNK78_05980 [Planctomycetes bacterium]|nr:hypothetical protein [Planctomycetota bacterium]